jgi:hypothetical protein
VEQGFGTGLRAKVERTQSEGSEAGPRQVPVAVAIAYATDDGGAGRLRDELEASLER